MRLSEYLLEFRKPTYIGETAELVFESIKPRYLSQTNEITTFKRIHIYEAREHDGLKWFEIEMRCL